MKHIILSGRALFFILMTFVITAFYLLPGERISLSMTNQTLKNGKKVTITADIFYRSDQSVMITHYLTPMEYIFIANNKGEARIYNPAKNEVVVTTSSEYDTEKSLLYYFFTRKTDDLGLKDLGFKLTQTKFDRGMKITTWLAPAQLANKIATVEMVHENFLPIYLAYMDKKGKILRKIYYDNYITQNTVTIPGNVTEFNYLSDGDSIIVRTKYSNLKINPKDNNPYFNYQIPSNARLVE